jgi:hypothetical protein
VRGLPASAVALALALCAAEAAPALAADAPAASASPAAPPPSPPPPPPQSQSEVYAWLKANKVDTKGWIILGFDRRGVTFTPQDFHPAPGSTIIQLPSRSELFAARTLPEGGGMVRSMAYTVEIDCANRRRMLGAGKFYEQNGLGGQSTDIEQIGTGWKPLDEHIFADQYALKLCQAAASPPP